MASVPAFCDVVFSDPTIDLANYSATAQFVNAEAVSITGANCASCGVGSGKALQFLSTFGDTTTAEGIVDLGFVNNTFTYDPGTQGALSSVSASVDKDLAINITTAGGNPFGNTFRPLIEQDGFFFLAAIPGPSLTGGSTGFNTLSKSGLVAADFSLFDFSTALGAATGTVAAGPQHPNFSGDPMSFGLGQITGIQGFTNPNALVTATYDNLSFDLQPVPEPSSLILFGSLIPALAAIRFIRRARG